MFLRVLSLLALVAFTSPAFPSAFGPLKPNLGLSEAEFAALPRTPDGKYAMFGDILIRVVEQGKLAEVTNLWPGGVFVYAFDADITPANRALFTQACTAWTVGTPIVCRVRTTEKDYFQIHTRTGAFCGGSGSSCSPMGWYKGVSDMYIDPNHWQQAYVLQHEIGHALGKIHEQSRADRGDYVDIQLANAPPHQWHNFDVVEARLFTEYDYDSIMHYRNCAYSVHSSCNETTINLQTIVVRSCARDNAGGSTITQLDLDGIRNAYAPGLAALLVRERSTQCGVGSFHPDMLASNEAQFPLGPTAVGWRKVETNYSSTCGFAPVGFGRQCRKPKEYITSWDDTDSRPLDFNCMTLYEVWVECGCKVVSTPMACTNITKFGATFSTLSVGEKAFRDPEQWRTTRVLYFKEIADGLAADGLLTQEVTDFLPAFYQMNYLDRRFETKMFRARAGMHAYARWKASVEPGYQLTLEMFKKIATYRRLRIE